MRKKIVILEIINNYNKICTNKQIFEEFHFRKLEHTSTNKAFF